jgi:hypothetical protein
MEGINLIEMVFKNSVAKLNKVGIKSLGRFLDNLFCVDTVLE